MMTDLSKVSGQWCGDIYEVANQCSTGTLHTHVRADAIEVAMLCWSRET
jgi:hypothetical protein